MLNERLRNSPDARADNILRAAAVLLCRADEFLLLQRVDGTWATPGGKEDPEDKQRIEQTAVRELFEEVGVKVLAEDLVYLGYTEDVHEGKPYIFHTHRFATRDYIGVPTIKEEDKCTGLGWYRLNQLPQPMFEFTNNDLKRQQTRQFIRQF